VNKYLNDKDEDGNQIATGTMPDNTKYGEVFAEGVATVQVDGCDASKCITTCTCADGWTEGTAPNTSSYYQVTSTRGYGTSNMKKTCHKAKATPVYFHVTDCQVILPPQGGTYSSTVSSATPVYRFNFKMTDSETNTTKFTTTSVFADSDLVGYGNLHNKGFAPQKDMNISIYASDLGLSASDENSTSWKTVDKSLSSDSEVLYYLDSAAFAGASDKVTYVLHGTCLLENACTSDKEYITANIDAVKARNPGFNFMSGRYEECYKVLCDSGYSDTVPTSGPYDTVTYTGPSGTTYECYKSGCSNDSKYFQVNLSLTSLPDDQTNSACAMGDGYRQIVPSWAFVNSSARLTGNNSKFTLESVNGSNCSDTGESSYIQVGNLYMNTKLCDNTANSSWDTGFISYAYKVNCANASVGTTLACCYMKGSTIESYNKSCYDQDTQKIVNRKSYISGIASVDGIIPTVKVCGADLKPGNKYTFTFKEESSGCEYTKDLTVQINSTSGL
jgi:hypothetical protein